MSQPESRILNHILAYLKQKGGRWIKIHGGDSPFQEVGIADILGCYHGRAVAIEVKTPTGKLSKKQVIFLDDWASAGGYTCVATSTDPVVELLAKIDKLGG